MLVIIKGLFLINMMFLRSIQNIGYMFFDTEIPKKSIRNCEYAHSKTYENIKIYAIYLHIHRQHTIIARNSSNCGGFDIQRFLFISSGLRVKTCP